MSDPSGIEWVVFDAVGTILFADPPVHMAYHRVGRRHGAAITPPEASHRFRKAMAECPVDLETDPERERAFWRGLVERVLPDVSDKETCFEDLWRHFAQPSSWAVYADLEDCLAGLRQRGIGVAIASNFDERLHPVCNGHDLLAVIERRFVSSEIGWKKPAPQFFEAVIRNLGVSPNSILMVGDDPTADLAPARAAGMQAILVDRSGSGPPDSIACLTEILDRLPPQAL